MKVYTIAGDYNWSKQTICTCPVTIHLKITAILALREGIIG